MSTNYKQIADENIRRYGTDIDEYGPILLSNRYSDRTHFVYELLQNAEDAIGWRLNQEDDFPRDVAFELGEEGLLFRHHGLPFGEEHVRGICNIGRGTKGQDLSAIGKHGIGFKSVYAYTHHPEIHSGDEHFLIDSFVRPCGVPPRATLASETRFWLPFDHPEVNAEDGYAEIANRLRALGLGTLLFLRNVQSITWTLACGTKGQYLRDARHLEDGVDRVTLLGQSGDEEEISEEWLVFSKAVSNVGRPAGFVEVAFKLEMDAKTGEERVVAVDESPLVVFFPTEKETHFGFLIQGPYRTTPSRDNIPKDDAWNKELVSQTARLVVSSMQRLRDLNLLGVSALACLIADPYKYSTGSQVAVFQPIAEAIVRALKNDRYIPSSDDNYLSGADACIARAESLRSLITGRQLHEITGSKSGWVTGDITRDRAGTLRNFLVEIIGVKEIDAADFVRDISEPFLTAQTDDWIERFYSFLLDQQAIRRQPWFAKKPIVRLQNGTHVTALDSNGSPNAYLPGDERTDFPTVRKSVCNGDALQLLVQLGLKPPDLVDDIIRNVLPRYQGDQVEVSDDDGYSADIQRILEAFIKDVAGQRKLIAALRESVFVMSADAGDGAKYISKATEVYLATERLKNLFSGVSGVMLVDDGYPVLHGEKIRDLLEACGTSRNVRPISDESISWDERARLREQAGHPETSGYKDKITDWMLEGLSELLEILPELSVEEASSKARLLWDELAHLEERRGKGVFTGEYSWSHYGSYRQSFDSAFVRKLNSTPWVPDASGCLQRPELILFDSLGWQPHPFLESKIRFKPPIIETLAKEAGIEPGILDLLKKLGLTSEAELRSRLGEPSDDDEEAETSSGEDTDSQHESDDVGDAIKNLLGDASNPTPPVSESGESEGPSETGSGRKVSGQVPGTGKGGLGGTGGGNGRSSGGALGGRTSHKNGEIGGTGARPFISYVATQPDEEETDPDGLEYEARMALEEKAIALILKDEPQLNRTPTHNPGYDLFEDDANGEPIRFVEVKAMSGDLNARPVGLSSTQFECAREHGDAYWLYVVEYAGDQSSANIVRIRDPYGKAQTFTFDHGWRGVAENGPVDGSSVG